MKTNKQKTVRAPENFWKLRRDPKGTPASYRPNENHGSMVRVQSVGFDATGKPLCAGVYWVPDLSARYAWKLARHWDRWRTWFNKLPWTKDCRHAEMPRLAYYGIHPIDNPKHFVGVNH